MNLALWYGAVLGAAAVVAVFLMVRRLRRMRRYEHVVRAHLGDAVTAYNETVMIRFYDADMSAADAAREMVAVSREP